MEKIMAVGQETSWETVAKIWGVFIEHLLYDSVLFPLKYEFDHYNVKKGLKISIFLLLFH